MNDTELDDMLNEWKAPAVPKGLRERISQEPPRPKWKFRLPSGLFFGLAAGAAMFLLVVGIAAPQTLGTTPRFNFISQIIDHNADGSSSVNEYRTSTANNGAEIMLEQNFPDSWFMTLHSHFFDTVHRMLGISRPPPSMASDCSFRFMSVIGHETILNYRTTVQREVDQDGTRYTEWRSPDLDCITMKYLVERPLGNGQFRIVRERRPQVVTINRAQ